jgi:N-formylglutamate amidohydrolase
MISEPPGIGSGAARIAKLGQPHEPELDPPFEVLEPAVLGCPLVYSSPHSGDVYPRRFLDRTRLTPAQLRRSEDAFVDSLFGGVRGLDAPMIRARFPRCYLDLNREPYELDPRMFDGRVPAFSNTRSMRVAGGLGTIPRVASQGQEIYAARLPVEEAIGRIEKLYKPYHARLRELLARAQQSFGVAVLVDCHSMPSGASSGDSIFGGPARLACVGDGKPKADFVIGDRHGTSCATALVDVVEATLRDLGFIVHRNKPYAGGFITEHYGNPAASCHAMQIEVSRALYMDEQNVSRSERFAEVSAALTKVATALAAAVTTRLQALRTAAE